MVGPPAISRDTLEPKWQQGARLHSNAVVNRYDSTYSSLLLALVLVLVPVPVPVLAMHNYLLATSTFLQLPLSTLLQNLFGKDHGGNHEDMISTFGMINRAENMQCTKSALLKRLALAGPRVTGEIREAVTPRLSRRRHLSH